MTDLELEARSKEELRPFEPELAERRLRGAELALAGARRELERNHGQVAARRGLLERALEQQRSEPVRLQEQLRESERARRLAQQRAHAEQVARERAELLAARLAREHHAASAAGAPARSTSSSTCSRWSGPGPRRRGCSGARSSATRSRSS